MEDYPESVTIQCHKKILQQMSNSIYKFKTNEGKVGFCIFCHIKYGQKLFPVLITKYDIINEEYLSNKNSVNVLICNKEKIIEFGKVKYLGKEYDISIIEIKENINIKINILELDENVYEKNNDYINESIYILHFNNKNNISVSYGIIKGLNEFEIKYLSNKTELPKNSPIFNLSSNKVIGLYQNNNNYYNKGIFFNILINEFIKEYRHEQKLYNEIDLYYKVNYYEIHKKHHFLDNFAYIDDQDIKHQQHDNLQELNEFNTELYIDNEKVKYKKYFIPKKEGEYKITLKFNVFLTNCSYMFAGCKNITKINFNSFNTKYITNMKYMFYFCEDIKNINLFYFNTENVTDMSYMFCNCYNLNNLDLSSFDTKNVTEMSHMFSNCEKADYINVSSFNTKNVKNMSYMFCNCYNLNNLDLSSFDTKNVEDIRFILFNSDTSKKNNFIKNKKKEFLNKYYKQKENKGINEIHISIDIDKTDINKEIFFLNKYFYELDNKKAKLYINNIEYEFNKFFIPKKEGKYIIKLKFFSRLFNCSYMFSGCRGDINFVYLDTGNVTKMKGMFFRRGLNDLDLSCFDTKNVKDMSYIFYRCTALRNLDISSFDTNNVRDMNHFFYHCDNIRNLELSSFNTKNVTDMSYMFFNCYHNLRYLDLHSFYTKNVTDMSFMFCYCFNLRSLDISSFNTKNVTSTKATFNGCCGSVNLKLSNFCTINVVDMSFMFNGCYILKNLDLSSFNTKYVEKIESIFYEAEQILNFNSYTFRKFNKKILLARDLEIFS